MAQILYLDCDPKRQNRQLLDLETGQIPQAANNRDLDVYLGAFDDITPHDLTGITQINLYLYDSSAGSAAEFLDKTFSGSITARIRRAAWNAQKTQNAVISLSAAELNYSLGSLPGKELWCRVMATFGDGTTRNLGEGAFVLGKDAAAPVSNGISVPTGGAINTYLKKQSAADGDVIWSAGTASDATAIHDDVSAEISAITGKATIVDADTGLMEDSAASDAKKSWTFANVKTWIKTWIEGTHILSTGEGAGTKFLREDGDGTSSWQTVTAASVEGTGVLSTGEGAGTKYLREDGDGTSSWQAISGSGITSLNALGGTTQTFTNDTNVTVVSGGTAHVITWSGDLSVARGGTG